MIIFRILLLAFNVGVVVFLIYRMIEYVNQPVPRSKKIIFVAGGVLLLLAPLGIFLRFFSASPSYLMVYPAAIAIFLYLTKQL